MSAAPELSSTSRLGRTSSAITTVTSLAGLGCGLLAAWREEWELLAPAAILMVLSLVTWFTRVRTTVGEQEVTFAQLGKRIRVPIAEVHACTAHEDRVGLGAGLRWYGKRQWGMLSGDDYVEVLYDDGRSLLVSHRSAENLCRFLTKSTS